MAIGDGSNDVAMIQEAHIGIGLFGFEGAEAANNSDYAIIEFKSLRRLIFNHGMNIGYKSTKFIYIFMFKSVVPCFVGFLFGFHTVFSGQKAWEDIY